MGFSNLTRLVTNSITFSDTTTVVQVNSSAGVARSLVWKPRVGNTGNIYVATSSSFTSSSGFELIPGDREDWHFTGGVRVTDFYAIAASSGDRLDWAMEVDV